MARRLVRNEQTHLLCAVLNGLLSCVFLTHSNMSRQTLICSLTVHLHFWEDPSGPHSSPSPDKHTFPHFLPWPICTCEEALIHTKHTHQHPPPPPPHTLLSPPPSLTSCRLLPRSGPLAHCSVAEETSGTTDSQCSVTWRYTLTRLLWHGYTLLVSSVFWGEWGRRCVCALFRLVHVLVYLVQIVSRFVVRLLSPLYIMSL